MPLRPIVLPAACLALLPAPPARSHQRELGEGPLEGVRGAPTAGAPAVEKLGPQESHDASQGPRFCLHCSFPEGSK
jgi:hypothetical protein